MTHHRTQRPSRDEYAKALTVIRPKLTDGHLRMLAAHLNAPGHTISARELAAAAGYSNFRAVNAQYGRLGRLLAIETQFRPGQASSSFAEFSKARGAEWAWHLLPEFADALRSLAWFSK